MNIFFITGIPRSGTSYLSHLLHQIDNFVVMNEPKNYYVHLNDKDPIRSLLDFHGIIHQKIIRKQYIENKISNGRLTTDTMSNNQYQSYIPQIQNHEFFLGTKNTLGYLARLELLIDRLPNVPIIASIRNPLQTLYSWGNSFPHLQQAKPSKFKVGHLYDTLLRNSQRQRLLEIETEENTVIRRALLWNYLAETLIAHDKKITLLHYESLVENPRKSIQLIVSKIDNTTKYSIPNFPSSSPKRYNISEIDREIICNICSRTAAKLGYNL